MALVKCKECGRIISDQASVCPNCGAPQTSNATNAANLPNNNQQYAQRHYAPQPQQPYIPQAQRPAYTPVRRNNNNTLLIVIIAILAVLVLVMVGYLVFVNMENKKAEQIEQPVAATQTQAKTATQTQAKEETTSQLSQKQAEEKPAASGSEIWAGKIGGKYKIHMKLNSDTGEFYYYYDKYGPNHVLNLTCTDSYGNHLTLIEENQYGEQTGMFDGDVNGNTFSGTFTNFEHRKSYSFKMRRQ